MEYNNNQIKNNQMENFQQKILEVESKSSNQHSNPSSQSSATNRASSHKISDYYEKYIQQMSQFNNLQNEFSKILKCERFIYSNKFQQIFSSQIIQSNFQSNTVKIHYKNILIYINVLFTSLDDQIFNGKIVGQGTFGKIYKINYESKQYAIKRLNIIKTQFGFDFNKIYQQYFFSMIASTLQFGPKSFQIFGYDIITTKQYAYFVMQLCLNLKYLEQQKVSKQLKQNLKIMHSLKLIHLDIKPSNIAYSTEFQKYIFIDFGLSIFVNQEIGFKTYIGFNGTFSYCSEEMKKIYILDKPEYIDLYYNDLISLNKTLKKLNSNAKTIQQQFKTSHENLMLCQQFQTCDSFLNNNYQFSVLNESVIIFLIKFYSYKNNIFQLIKLIKNNNNQNKLIMTLYVLLIQLANKPQFNQISEFNNNIVENLQQLKNKIIEKNYIITQNDLVLSNYFIKMKQIQCKFQNMTISQFLCLKSFLFCKLLENKQLVYKLFIYFNPLSNFNLESKNHKQKNKQHQHKRNLIIQKIWAALSPNIIQNQIFYRKTRFALVFFSKKLINIENIQIFQSLRILFIAIGDFLSMKNMQIKILQNIQKQNNNFLYILILIEFYLFSCICYERSILYNSKQIKNILKQKNKQSKNLNDIKFSLFISFAENIFQYQNTLNQNKSNFQSMLQKIQQCMRFSTTQSQRQILLNIKYLFYQINKIIININTKNISLKFYSLYFKYNEVNYENICFFEHIKKTFSIINPSFNYNIFKIQKSQKLQNSIQWIFDAYGEKIEAIPQWIQLIFYYYFRINKDLIILFLQKFIQYSNLSLAKYNQQNSLQEVTFFLFIKKIFFFFTNILVNTSKYNLFQKLNEQQLVNLIFLLRNLFANLGQKIFLKQVKQIQQIVHSILIKYIECAFESPPHLQMIKNAQLIYKNHRQKINNYKQIKYIYLQYIKIVKLAINLNSQQKFNKVIYQKLPTNIHLNNLILSILEDQQSEKIFQIFNQDTQLLSSYIIIGISNNQNQRNYQILVKYLNYLYNYKTNSKISKRFVFVLYPVCVFSQNTPVNYLADIYKKFVLNCKYKRDINMGEVLLNFKIFQRIIQQLDYQSVQKQLKKFSLYLPKMQYQYLSRIKSHFYIIFRQTKLYLTKRKQFYCAKTQVKTLSQANLTILKNIIDSFIKKMNNKQVKIKLSKKIIQLYKNLSSSFYQI